MLDCWIVVGVCRTQIYDSDSGNENILQPSEPLGPLGPLGPLSLINESIDTDSIALQQQSQNFNKLTPNQVETMCEF